MNQDFTMENEYENVVFPIIRENESGLKNNMIGKADNKMLQNLEKFSVTKAKDLFVVCFTL